MVCKIGTKVYISNEIDVLMNRELRQLVLEKTILTLDRFDINGMALVKSDEGKEYKVRKSNLKIWECTQN